MLADRYRVLEVLGIGRNGIVVSAEDLQLDGDQLAVKLLHENLVSEPTILDRFRQEALLARQLSHPNIVRLYDFDVSADALPLLIMELVQGPSLRQLLDNTSGQRLSVGVSVEIVFQILCGLQHAHEKSIIHRDVKPENILISVSGIAKLGDFGVASPIQDSLGLTRTGEVVGTPAYLAPEQLEANPLSPATDLYSLGIVLFECLTGAVPFTGETYVSLFKQHSEKPVPQEKLIAAKVPKWTIEFIEKLLAKRPEDRFVSASDALAVLEPHRIEIGTTAKSLSSAVTRQWQKSSSRLMKRRYKTILHMLWLGNVLVTMFYLLPRQDSIIRMTSDVIRIENFVGRRLTNVRKVLRLFDVDPKQPSTIFSALANRNKDAVQAWCSSGVFSTARDRKGNTVAHILAEDPTLLKIAEGCIPPILFDVKNARGDTPILHAVHKGEADSINLLLNYGFNPNQSDAKGQLPIAAAIQSKRPEMVKSFSFRDVFPVHLNDPKNSSSLLIRAVRSNIPEVLEELLQLGIDVNQRDSVGRSALMIAAENASAPGIKILETLLAAGADPMARDNQGEQAIEYGKRAGNTSALKRLQQAIDSLKADGQ